METTFIYTLAHPLTNEVRYVGKSNDPQHRYGGHLRDKRKTHKNNWIQSLLKQGLRPKLEILEEVSIDEWQFWERYWIAQFKAWGFKLTNHRPGGEGMPKGAKHTEETKAKMSETHKNRDMWNRGVPVTDAAKANISAKLTGRKIPKDVSTKARATRVANAKERGYYHTKETRKKLSEANKGRGARLRVGYQHSDETKRKQREAALKRSTSFQKNHTPWSKGKKLSTKSIEKRTNTRREKDNYKQTSVSRSKISLALKKVGHKPTAVALKRSREANQQTVLQLGLDLVLIKEWSSIECASESLNVSNSGISACCRDIQKTAGGFVFKYKMATQKRKRQSRKKTTEQILKQSKPIIQLNIKHETIQAWPSARIAGQILRISPSDITAVCKGRQKTTKGFIFK